MTRERVQRVGKGGGSAAPKPRQRRQERVRRERPTGSYFAAPATHLEFIPSGCKLLDCALGGGWVLGRVANIVGDKSTGKTLQAIEACANFARTYKRGKIWYRETEAAFDESYAEALGMPLSRIDFGKGKAGDLPKFDTVEDIFEDLEKILTDYPEDQPGLYIVDSLDALTDRAEQARKIDEASYGTGKARKMSELFRRLIRKLDRSRVCVIIVSQTREKIGVTFGEKYTRTGGKALDFYASQIVWLSHLGAVSKTVNKVKRPIGINVRAKVKKNKVGLPMREAEYGILFGFGVDNLVANLDWLVEVKRLGDADLTEASAKRLVADINDMTSEEYAEESARLDDVVVKAWSEIEQSFLPRRRKY